MIQFILHRLFKRRHFWRHATFSEIAELYASRMLRVFALRIIAVFTSVFLYQEGFDLVFIALFWAAFYALKVLFSWPSAFLIARIGPKHVTLLSNIVSALAMVFLPFAPEYGLYVLIPWNVLQAFSGSSNDLAYLVDFSKVKSVKHAGKELGYMNIVEKVATGLSPLIGGALAYFYSPGLVMFFSSLLFLLSAIPLLLTAEPVATHQKLAIRGFPWRNAWRSITAEGAVGFDVFVTGTVWSLFMTVIIFADSGSDIYVKIGAFASIALFAALASSYIFGKLIDHRRGRELLRLSTILNSFLHVLRPFIASPAGIILMNSANEVATTGYNMSFMRGLFDTADRSGRRIVYLAWVVVMQNIGAMLAAILLATAFIVFGFDNFSFAIFFILSGFVTLAIATPRFALYRK